MTINLYVEMIVSGNHRKTKGTHTEEKITTVTIYM